MSRPSGHAVPTIPENHTISISSSSSSSITREPKVRTPRLDLFLEGSSMEEYNHVGLPLYEAAVTGDWKAAETSLRQKQDLVCFAITGNHDTLLHIAASAKRTKAAVEFVEHLVDFMERDDLEVQNKNGDTALNLAAEAGNVEIAKKMLEKNPGLIDIPNKKGQLPLYTAALFARHEMVRYLYGISNKMAGDLWNDGNRGLVLQKCVESEIFDVAIQIVNDIPNLLEERGLVQDILLSLAGNTKAFEVEKPNAVFRIFAAFAVKENREQEGDALQLLRIIWRKVATLSKIDIDDILQGRLVVIKKENKEKEGEVLPYLRKILEKMDTGLKIETEKENQVQASNSIDTQDQVHMRETINTYPFRVLFVAAKMGNTRFITELIRFYPDAILNLDDKGKTIFHLAVKRRNAKIYSLLYEINAKKDLITSITDIKGNNMLHMVAKNSKQNQLQNVSGAALHMRREYLWFKEVEKMIPPQYRQRKNNYGETPQDVFAKKHASLITKGESWMKNYMLVATLIATIVFAAAFTLPGGYNQNTGIPIFQDRPSFVIFVISDAISLISSSTSILAFLSILTSSYADLEFLVSLPGKLVFGVATLFLSILSMMVAFSASFFLLYTGNLKWLPITVTCLAGMPIIQYAKTQFHLLDIFYYSTYGSILLFNPKKKILYY